MGIVHSISVIFFFQAEDGIRDYKVTGVQTCALPISTAWQTRRLHERYPEFRSEEIDIRDADAVDRCVARHARELVLVIHTAAQPSHEIGRASCRERV